MTSAIQDGDATGEELTARKRCRPRQLNRRESFDPSSGVDYTLELRLTLPVRLDATDLNVHVVEERRPDLQTPEIVLFKDLVPNKPSHLSAIHVPTEHSQVRCSTQLQKDRAIGREESPRTFLVLKVALHWHTNTQKCTI